LETSSVDVYSPTSRKSREVGHPIVLSRDRKWNAILVREMWATLPLLENREKLIA
jgi:hypothetical protein